MYVYVCMYVCMCMYVCVCMHMYICMYVCVCVYVCMYVCMYMNMYVCMYIYININTNYISATNKSMMDSKWMEWLTSNLCITKVKSCREKGYSTKSYIPCKWNPWLLVKSGVGIWYQLWQFSWRSQFVTSLQKKAFQPGTRSRGLPRTICPPSRHICGPRPSREANSPGCHTEWFFCK